MKLGVSHLIDPGLMPLVEQSRSFYADRVAGRGPGSQEELHAVRTTVAAPAASTIPPVEESVSAAGRSVPVRIHPPTDKPATGVVLEIHGGGFYLGSAADSDNRNRQLADSLGVAVVSVDYRLAPEHPWPAAPEDCQTAALWLAANAADRFGTTKLAIIGFSASTHPDTQGAAQPHRGGWARST